MMCRTCYKCNTVPGMQGCKRQLCQKHSVAIFKSDWLQATVTEHIREDFSYMAFLTSFLIRLMVCPPTVLSQTPAHNSKIPHAQLCLGWTGCRHHARNYVPGASHRSLELSIKYEQHSQREAGLNCMSTRTTATGSPSPTP